jgi:hypothetical protein
MPAGSRKATARNRPPTLKIPVFVKIADCPARWTVHDMRQGLVAGNGANHQGRHAMIRTLSTGAAVAFAALLVMGSASVAQTPTPTIDPLAEDAKALKPAGDTVSQVAFAYADRNEDELVSWEEYRNRAMRLFGRVDINDDGILEVTELQVLAGPNAPAPKRAVDLPTYNAALREAFNEGDKNSDGVLTPTEWSAVVRPSKLF